MYVLSSVSFYGDTIFCIDYEGQPFTPMRPVVENMGLDWSAQAAKLRANKERWTVVIIATVAQDGNEREMLCMPLRKFPAWLASLNPNKVRPELRQKIELYQNESDDALWNYWMNGRAERPVDTSTDSPITPDQQCTLRALVKARVEATPEDRREKGIYPQIWSRFNNHFRIARYAQLPQSKMSEAIAYLVKMELKPKSLKEAPQQIIPEDMDGRRKRILNELRDLEDAASRLFNEVKLCLHPAGVSPFLTGDPLLVYQTLCRLNYLATSGIYSAREAIASGWRIASLFPSR